MATNLLNLPDAQKHILRHFHSFEIERLSLNEWAGRIPAPDFLSVNPPLLDNSYLSGIGAQPVQDRLTGINDAVAHPQFHVRLIKAIESEGRESYLRAVVVIDDTRVRNLRGHHDIGNLLSLVRSNALLIIPAGVKSLPVGTQADAWML